MCGIAGFIGPISVEARITAVSRMCEAMLHRGPDDQGIVSVGEATIGMRRLAIFDPANGHQPMATPDGRFTIVFNGAIYNYRELREVLTVAGHSFRTNCDTEVLLAAFAEWGERCLQRLRGMFAFAVWDRAEGVLFFARDPFGIKPLYYHHGADGRLVIASELNALCSSGGFVPEIDPSAVADYLAWLAVPAPRTIYRTVRSLRPGECALWQEGRLITRAYWGFNSIPQPPEICRSPEEFREQLRFRLEDTVRAHVVADVPVGAFLSGGLDSAVITALMTRVGGTALKTFSIGFTEADYSEVDAAAETARHLGTQHHTRVLTGKQVSNDLETILQSLDQPTGDGINTYYASQTARTGGVTVALSGLGGDELFGGYPSFQQLPQLARWLPAWRRLPKLLRRLIISRLNRGDTRQRKLADFLRYARDLNEMASLQRRVFSEKSGASLLSRDARTAIAGSGGPYHPELNWLATDLADAGATETISAWELHTYMADVLLRDSDVMSMRHSLELRVPFIDRPFIEWLWHQPARFKEDRANPKSSLAAATRDLLPPALLNRRKQGFSLPFPIWMRSDLKPFLEETFSPQSIARSGLFSPDAATALWKGFLAGHDTREWSRVWSMAVLIAFINRRGPATPAASDETPRPRSTLACRTPTPRSRPCTLLLAPEIFSSVGGIPRILQLYLKALSEITAARGEGLRLVALNDPVLDSSDLKRYTSGELDDWLMCDRNKIRFMRRVFRLSRGCNRIVCGHVAQLPVAWAARLLNRRLRYYLVAHGIEVWRPFSWIEGLALRGAEKILCVSDFTRRELLKHCPLPTDKTVVLHNALDPYFTLSAGKPLAECPPTILTVTRLSFADRYKGVEHLIAAMPLVKAAIPNAQLRIIGRGDDLPRLQGLARQLGLFAESVEFLGFANDQQMESELSACRLFALPSRKEGFGLVFLEALAHGRPCLGANTGGIPEVITPETGVLTPFGDVPGIAAACIDALQRNWRQEAMLERARHFSYSRFKDQLDSLLTPHE